MTAPTLKKARKGSLSRGVSGESLPRQIAKLGEKRLDKALGAKARDYAHLYNASPLQRVETVKAGLRAGVLVDIANDMHVPRDQVYAWTGLARATVNRKVQENAKLSPMESERAMGIATLIGQVEKIVTESGEGQDFDPAQWTARWLGSPNPALGGKAPGDLMDTSDGRQLVSQLVGQMQSGAYS